MGRETVLQIEKLPELLPFFFSELGNFSKMEIRGCLSMLKLIQIRGTKMSLQLLFTRHSCVCRVKSAQTLDAYKERCIISLNIYINLCS